MITLQNGSIALERPTRSAAGFPVGMVVPAQGMQMVGEEQVATTQLPGAAVRMASTPTVSILERRRARQPALHLGWTGLVRSARLRR